LPSETFSQGFTQGVGTVLGGEGKLSNKPQPSPWPAALPADAALNRLLCNAPEYETSFPRMEGALFLPVHGKQVMFVSRLQSSRQAWALDFSSTSHLELVIERI
jgi:hypothetical protein